WSIVKGRYSSVMASSREWYAKHPGAKSRHMKEWRARRGEEEKARKRKRYREDAQYREASQIRGRKNYYARVGREPQPPRQYLADGTPLCICHEEPMIRAGLRPNGTQAWYCAWKNYLRNRRWQLRRQRAKLLEELDNLG